MPTAISRPPIRPSSPPARFRLRRDARCDPPRAAGCRRAGAGAAAARSRRRAPTRCWRCRICRAPTSRSPSASKAASTHCSSRVSGKRKRKKHRSQTRKFEAAGGFRRIEAKHRRRRAAAARRLLRHEGVPLPQDGHRQRLRRRGGADASSARYSSRRCGKPSRPSCCTRSRSAASCAPSPARACRASA